jgi:Na+/H+-translocating membrane pyrophosphatase
MTKKYTKYNLTAPQLLAVVALIIFLVGGILAFQAWLLGVVLSWF